MRKIRLSLAALTLLAALPIGMGSSVVSEQLRWADTVPAYGGNLVAAERTAPVTTVDAAPAPGQPMLRATERVTKKPFGIYITPETSPVQPDIFFGFHSGVDFETFPDEQDTDVPVFAICDGQLIEKAWARGYGGLAVQRCQLNGEDVVVTYGHVNVASVTATDGEALKRGTKIALLGKGFTEETDGRRKHLHLGIHRGDEFITKGYVANKSDLDAYIDFRTLTEGKH